MDAVKVRKVYRRSKSSGFTLVELLVVIAIIGIVAGIGILLNVQSYFDRAKDTQRKHDLGQIHTALEVYRADHNYYPPSLTFGSPLSDNGQVYMATVPQDPDCSKGSHPCYLYVTDQTNPSQPAWFVTYAKLANSVSGTSSCDLSCVPPAPTGYDLCVYGGTVDCNALTSGFGATPSPTGSGTTPTAQPPTNTPIPTSTPTSSPTSSPTPIPPLAFDAKSSATAPSGTTSLSWSHITTAHPNTILLVPVTTNYPISVGSVTYNGIALTKLVSYNFGYSGDDFWYLKSPPAGTYTVTVNISGGTSVITAGGLTYYNVDLTNPFGTPAVNYGVSTFSTPTFSVTVPSTASQLVIDSAAFNDNDDPVVAGSGQATLWNIKTNNFNGVSSQPGGTGNTTMSWTLQNKYSHNWIDLGVALNP